MPLVEIKVFEGELSQPQSKELIQKVTEVMVSFGGENLRQATWVVVQEVKSGNGGSAAKRWVSMTSGQSRRPNRRTEVAHQRTARYRSSVGADCSL